MYPSISLNRLIRVPSSLEFYIIALSLTVIFATTQLANGKRKNSYPLLFYFFLFCDFSPIRPECIKRKNVCLFFALCIFCFWGEKNCNLVPVS